MSYQRRYVAYARAHGMSPDQMIEHDETAWPGGKMCGFILWMSAQWKAFGKPEIISSEDHQAFDEWLDRDIRREAA